jgi:hypothetical protein
MRLDTLGSERLGLPGNSQRNVQFETSRPLGKPTVTEKVENFWLLPGKTYTRTIVAKYKPTAFSLVVDDFAVKYVTKADARHLRNTLLRHYEITTDWDGAV